VISGRRGVYEYIVFPVAQSSTSLCLLDLDSPSLPHSRVYSRVLSGHDLGTRDYHMHRDRTSYHGLGDPRIFLFHNPGGGVVYFRLSEDRWIPVGTRPCRPSTPSQRQVVNGQSAPGRFAVRASDLVCFSSNISISLQLEDECGRRLLDFPPQQMQLGCFSVSHKPVGRVGSVPCIRDFQQGLDRVWVNRVLSTGPTHSTDLRITCIEPEK
jgi:hypothetical protein